MAGLRERNLRTTRLAAIGAAIVLAYALGCHAASAQPPRYIPPDGRSYLVAAAGTAGGPVVPLPPVIRQAAAEEPSLWPPGLGMPAESGAAVANPSATPPTPQALIDAIRQRLPQPGAPQAPAGPASRPAESRAAPQYTIPMASPAGTGEVKVEKYNGLISIVAREVSLARALSEIAELEHVNLVFAQTTDTKISISLHDVTVEQAFDALLPASGYTWVRQGNVIQVSSIAAASTLPPEVQGRIMEIFTLDYISAVEVEKIVKGLLSPVGHSYVLQNTPTNLRMSSDLIVVEDLPGYMERVRQYIGMVDVAPRQVLIEAHVLKVDLSDNMKHGINWQHLFELTSRNAVNLQVTPLGEPEGGGFLATLSGGNLYAVIECIKETTDSKTLASPKALVINGQEAKIQVGEQIGYKTTTTTETAAMETVQFLDTGVVLSITPFISRDNCVLLKIKPEISKGAINPTTQVPDKTTTNIETNVMLANGQGIVIGGLIDEEQGDSQSKIPILGDIWLIGRLFQRGSIKRERSELIITVIPRIMPYDGCYESQHAVELARTTSPLFTDGLKLADRPWEPRLPDASQPPEFLSNRSRPIVTEACPSAEIVVGPEPIPAPAPALPPQVSIDGEMQNSAYPETRRLPAPQSPPAASTLPAGPLSSDRRAADPRPVYLK